MISLLDLIFPLRASRIPRTLSTVLGPLMWHLEAKCSGANAAAFRLIRGNEVEVGRPTSQAWATRARGNLRPFSCGGVLIACPSTETMVRPQNLA